MAAWVDDEEEEDEADELEEEDETAAAWTFKYPAELEIGRPLLYTFVPQVENGWS